jgi:protein-S-isoprenylcysteine O-methyltransferase Ste14
MHRGKPPLTIPRAAALGMALFVWLVAIPFVHGIVPSIISLVGPRYGWTEGPSYWNLGGLVLVITGIAVLAWIMVIGFAQSSEMPGQVPLDWSPKLLLTSGPYALCRHPMYVAELVLWLGWAVYFGSPSVLVALTVMTIVIARLGPREERDLEAKFGQNYRDYAHRVPRWLPGFRRGEHP